MRIIAGMAAAVVTTTLLVAPQSAHAAKVTKPKVTAECKAASADRTVPLSGAKFGRCVLGGTFSSKTFTVKTKTSSFTEKTTYKHGKSMSLDSSVFGMRIVIIGKKTYLRPDKKSPWIQGKAKGNADQREVHGMGVEIRRTAKRSSQQAVYRWGSDWNFTGKTKTVKGVKQWQYVGAPELTSVFGEVDAVTNTVWVDKYFRPITDVLRITLDGESETIRSTYSGYGKKVTITAPKVK
ncbi:hypothetical protein [Nocardioides yefusunii]|uniref:Lipoprotein n=1 Tax=Nocardioides yefusunii TaxID=2500546 RepID=A0ABW1QS70_9ACTN|nr:hypothetical protein [Nocardioides yefusunii]